MTTPLNTVLLKLRTAHDSPKEIVRSLIPLLTSYETRILALEEKVDQQRQTIELLNWQLQERMDKVESSWDSFKKIFSFLGICTSVNTRTIDNSSQQIATQEVQVEPSNDASLIPQPVVDDQVAHQPLAGSSSPVLSMPADGSPIAPSQPTDEQPAPVVVPFVETARGIDKLRLIFRYEVDPTVGISYEELKSRFPYLKPAQLSNMCQRVKKDGTAYCTWRVGGSRWYPGYSKDAK